MRGLYIRKLILKILRCLGSVLERASIMVRCQILRLVEIWSKIKFEIVPFQVYNSSNCGKIDVLIPVRIEVRNRKRKKMVNK